MSDLSNDALSNPEFESLIQEFFRITSRSFNISMISPLVEAMKASKILEYIMIDSTHTAATSCLRRYIQSRPHLPQDFVGRFLAVFTSEINVMPNYMQIANQSYVAKVITKNVKPPTKVTNLMVRSMKSQLRSEIPKATIHVQSSTNVPTELKLQLNHNVMSTFVNSMSDLCKTIVEGNRTQGMGVDPYIQTQIRY
jgi:hypothetical protein